MSSWVSSEVSQALDQRHRAEENRQRVRYLALHLIVGLPLLLDVNSRSPTDLDGHDEVVHDDGYLNESFKLQIEQTLLVLIVLNGSFLVYKWLRTRLSLEDVSVELTPRQMAVLNLDPNQSHMGVRVKGKTNGQEDLRVSPFTVPPAEVTLASASDLSRSLLNLSNMSTTSMMEVSSSSWFMHNNSAQLGEMAKDKRQGVKVSPSRLKTSANNASMMSNQSWLTHLDVSRAQQDSSSFLNVSDGYQVSTPILHLSADASMKPSSVGAQGVGRLRHELRPSDVCRRLNIDARKLDQWVERLRIWMSETILKRLVAEIEDTNQKLTRIGLAEALIGDAGLERVKKCAQMPQVIASIPSLPSLLSFIDVTLDQRYLVSRIRTLASTGAMSAFHWNSGDSSWKDKMPTDAEILMHMFASYLDSQLPQMKGVIDGRSFSAVYLSKYPDKHTTFKSGFGIVQLSSRPPHFVFQVGEDQLELSAGRNNLFHTLLLFLHHVKNNESSMLGRLNLGLSGLNVLWVLE